MLLTASCPIGVGVSVVRCFYLHLEPPNPSLHLLEVKLSPKKVFSGKGVKAAEAGIVLGDHHESARVPSCK